MQGMTIAKFARAGDVGVETVRYYQRRGLLPTPARGDGVRRYRGDDLRRLRFIRSAQAAGFTLAEIAALLASSEINDRARIRALASARATALDAKIAELQAARAALRSLTEQCSATVTGPCPIVSAFEQG